MPDVVGYRAKFGVIVPSTNTVVEHDFNMIGPRGVTFHTGRMYIETPTLDSDETFLALIGQIRASISVAVRDVVTCQPDYMVMGMSAETFWNGVEGNRRFEARIRDATGLELSTGATSCRTALELLGVERIAVLTPYQPVADREVARFFTEAGFSVRRAEGLKCPTATSIAEVTRPRLINVLRDLDGEDVDAIVQAGTNLSMVRLAAEAEEWLGKPVIAINAATLWHALRSSGFDDRFEGFGSLLAEH
ncbi:MAG: arylmalonate decarboxylase [bacterium]|nr:arylmalonate decarboxylase [bacterium]MDE0287862.1 arylmalonate decarboxylase [bacterium]MDE0439802.1 arylmalonate decarboxylase [bacterium]